MRIASYILDILFPPRPNEKLLRPATALASRPGSHAGVTYLCHFSEPVVSAAITENKFHESKIAQTLLANLLTDWLKEQKKPVLLLAVPLSKSRYKERGYNQVSRILKKIDVEGVAVSNDFIIRAKDTVPQTSLSKEARLKNVKGAFAIKNSAVLKNLENTTVIVVDDVVTTGATLGAVRATLAPHLPPSNKLVTLALAH